MNRWLHLALAAQVLFFAGWGARLLTSHRDAVVVWLATEPVDPRDLLSGNYVALRYPIARTRCDHPDDARGGALPVWVELVPNGGPVAGSEPGAVIASAVGCRTLPPDAGDERIWIRGSVDPRNDRITLGIERMFVGENDPLRQATAGSVVAKVAINEAYEGRIVGLISTRPEEAR